MVSVLSTAIDVKAEDVAKANIFEDSVDTFETLATVVDEVDEETLETVADEVDEVDFFTFVFLTFLEKFCASHSKLKSGTNSGPTSFSAF